MGSRHIVAASIAGGLIAAASRSRSVVEAADIFADVFWTMYPDARSEHYVAWLERHKPQ